MFIFQDTLEEYNTVMNDNRTLEEIEKEIGETAPLSSDACISCSERWAMYGFLMCMQKCGDVVYSAAFAYYISMIMTDMGVSSQAESMYFTLKLEDKIIEIAQRYSNDKKECFNKVLEYFTTTDMSMYEKKIFLHNILLSEENYTKLDIHGNKTKHIIKLLKANNIHSPVLNSRPNRQVSFKLSYSMNKLFEELPGDSATEKILHII